MLVPAFKILTTPANDRCIGCIHYHPCHGPPLFSSEIYLKNMTFRLIFRAVLNSRISHSAKYAKIKLARK